MASSLGCTSERGHQLRRRRRRHRQALSSIFECIHRLAPSSIIHYEGQRPPRGAAVPGRGEHDLLGAAACGTRASLLQGAAAPSHAKLIRARRGDQMDLQQSSTELRLRSVLFSEAASITGVGAGLWRPAAVALRLPPLPQRCQEF